jgi:RNA polymerase sigma-70 factor (ECF subfamily)
MVGLLASTAAGDSRAFQELYIQSFSRLLPYALRIVKSREQAEDILQESYIGIWRDAGRFDNARAAPMTWMATIVRNKAIDFLRSIPVRHGVFACDDSSAAILMCDSASGPVETLERHQSRQQIGSGLIRIDQKYRQVIELAFFQELSHPEVALKMTVPLGTVKTWIRRGCQQMRQHVEACRP